VTKLKLGEFIRCSDSSSV